MRLVDNIVLISQVTRAWFHFWASFDGNARSVRKNK